MKKKLIITITSVMLVLASGSLLSMKSFKEITVSKNINVEVYKTASYVSDAYADTYATLQVTVVKVHGSKKEITWQHTFQPKQLKDYPASDKPMVQNIIIPNVNDKKEKLEIYYKVTYDTKGSELNFFDGTIIGKGEQSGKLNVKI